MRFLPNILGVVFSWAVGTAIALNVNFALGLIVTMVLSFTISFWLASKKIY